MICKKLIISWFKLICFVLAGYMVCVQLKTYCANQDMSITTYRNFKNEGQDVFPTFTICAVSKSWILNNEKMPYNHSAYVYSRILQGEFDDYMNYSKIRLDYVVIDVNSLISHHYTLTDEGIKIIPTTEQKSNALLEISHLDSKRVCVTKQNFEKYSLVEKEYVEFNISASVLRLGFVDLDFYIHQKGQLLRKLKYPNYQLYGNRVRKSVAKHNDSHI